MLVQGVGTLSHHRLALKLRASPFLGVMFYERILLVVLVCLMGVSANSEHYAEVRSPAEQQGTTYGQQEQQEHHVGVTSGDSWVQDFVRNHKLKCPPNLTLECQVVTTMHNAVLQGDTFVVPTRYACRFLYHMSVVI